MVLNSDGYPNIDKVYADVVFNVPIDKAYQYRVPENLMSEIQVGRLVIAEFGKRTERGCVVRLSDKAEIDETKIKPIKSIITPDFYVDEEIIEFSKWIADYYICSFGEALCATSFIGFADIQNPPIKAVQLADNYFIDVGNGLKPFPTKLTPKQQFIIDIFIKEKTNLLPLEKLTKVYQVGQSPISTLIKKGILIEKILPISSEESKVQKVYNGLSYNDEQKVAFEEIKKSIEVEEYKTFLLHGVTGSGKTELYLGTINEVLKKDKQAIVLVPEISLTPQTVGRFKSRFGDIVGVYHSRLTIREKFKLWQLIKKGEIKIIVGARSALFTPFESLGLIVIDEEHETTYKQENSPRYNARDTAIMRAHNLKAVVILGSATPSMESYANAKKGKFELLELTKRIDNRKMPEVRIIDLVKEVSEDKNIKQLSQPLIDGIKERLEKNEQVIILLNRRGFNYYVMCFNCNQAVKCEHCEMTMTYHKKKDYLLCHYCGDSKPAIKICPYCGSDNIVYMGAGTQRVEEEIRQIFDKARLLRMDHDSTTSKYAYDDYWQKISTHQIDIILGTQMIAKGFDLENVTLVGILSADSPLYLPDFRSAERTFSLLTQVAGRAGRSHRGGEVLIQTYNTKHYSIKFAQTHDYKGFYDYEIRIRKLLKFPPEMRIANIITTHKNEAKSKENAKIFSDILKNLCYRPQFRKLKVLGPAISPFAKLKDKFRWRVIVKSDSMKLLSEFVRTGLGEFNEVKPHIRSSIIVDIDPISLL